MSHLALGHNGMVHLRDEKIGNSAPSGKLAIAYNSTINMVDLWADTRFLFVFLAPCQLAKHGGIF